MSSSQNILLESGLKNLFRHDLRHHGNRYNLFVDNFAQFGVAFPSLSPLGLGPVCPRATLSTYSISNPTLQLYMLEDENTVSVQRQELDCLAWATNEKSVLPMKDELITIEASHVFKNERVLVSQFHFKNDSLVTQTIQPVWRGCISEEQEMYMLPYFHGADGIPRTTFLESTSNGLIGGLKVSDDSSDMTQVAVKVSFINSNLEVSIKNLAYEFSAKKQIQLGAGESVSFQFIIEVCLSPSDEKVFKWSDEYLKPIDFDVLCTEGKERFSHQIDIENPPKCASPALTMKAWRARHALLRDGMRGLDGMFGDEIASLCTSDNTDFSCVFFWDSLFSSVAISDFHPDYAKGAIRCAFVGMDERDGSTPERKFNYLPNGRMAQQSPQSPVASWAVRSYVEHHNDIDFLVEMYPTLVRNHQFWKKYSDTDGDGLSEFRWSGQVADNSPLWDQYAASDPVTGCGWIPPVASVPLNSFLYWDANNLANLADKLGLTEDAANHRARAAQLQRDLFAICYLPEEKRFWDYNHHTRQHRRVKTFYMFWPLFAGMDVPAETAKDLIENVLLDPEQFFGEIPFPSVAFDEPTYMSKGYWRGRAWPHISYWLIQTLVRYGYVEEAKEAARRTLNAYGRSAGFPENVATQPQDFDAAGFADYNWGCAAYYLLATEEYLNA